MNYAEIVFYMAIAIAVLILILMVYYVYQKKNVKPLVRMILLMAEIFADGIVTPEEWETLSQALKKALEINYHKTVKNKENTKPTIN